MTNQDKKRELRAFEALIVSQLRNDVPELPEPEDLPELTEADRAALDSLGPDFIPRLMAGALESPEEHREPAEFPEEEEDDQRELALAGAGEMFRGLNRAEGVDEEELEEKRKEMLDRLRKRKQQEKDDD